MGEPMGVRSGGMRGKPQRHGDGVRVSTGTEDTM
jgi:hypothetical protein